MLVREDEFLRTLRKKSNALQGVLIHGSDTAALADLTKAARVELGLTSELRLESTALRSDPSRLRDEYSAMSLLGEKQAIIVSGCDDAAVGALNGLFGAGSTGNFVVLCADALGKSSKLRSAAEAAEHFACVPIYEASPEALGQRVTQALASGGLRFAPGASDTFFGLVDNDRSALLNEVAKLSLYCFGQAEVTEQDVLAVCGISAEFSADELTDAVLSGEVPEADRAFSMVDDEPGQIGSVLQQMLYQVQRLQGMRSDMSGGTSLEQAMQRAKPPVFFKRKQVVGEQLRALDTDTFESLVLLLSRAVVDVRAQANLAQETALRAIYRMSGLVQQNRRLRTS
jgi:DNA polymerase III subunit delta